MIERSEGSDAAFALLADARRDHGDRVELRLAALPACGRARAEGLAGAGPVRAGRRSAGRDDQTRLRQTLAEAYFFIGRPTRARHYWTQFAEQQPNDLRSRRFLFDVAMQVRRHRGDAPAGRYSPDRGRHRHDLALRGGSVWSGRRRSRRPTTPHQGAHPSRCRDGTAPDLGHGRPVQGRDRRSTGQRRTGAGGLQTRLRPG